MSAPASHITLLELQSLIKRELECALPLTYWVAAEVSELKVNYSGHCYMQLVEKGGKKELAQASISAVAWRSSWGAVSSYFRTATGSDIAPGMKLLLRVAVSYHELYGLSLIISDIDPAYTLGDVEAERQRTIQQLQDEGVFGMNRELPLPAFMQRVAVISSRNAAGYQDFMRELEASAYRFEVTLFDAFMQGEAAVDSIIAALDAVADDPERFDALVVIRGGGSQSDLACFNNYRLCAHLAQFPLPVVTGIGHDKDRSVADMVAAVELKTPTAVAAYLVELMAGEEQYLAAMHDRIVQYATGRMETEKRALVQRSVHLLRVTAAMMRSMERRLDGLESEVVRRKEALLARRQGRLEGLKVLLRERSGRALDVHGGHLKLLAVSLEGRDPQRIMNMGFAVVRVGGRALRNSVDVVAGQGLEITLANGKIDAIVEKSE